MFASSLHSGLDLSPSVQTGLAWYYLIVCLANVAFAMHRQLVLKQPRQAMFWYVVAALFFLHGVIYFTVDPGPVLPKALRNLSDQGIQPGLIALGLETGGGRSGDWFSGAYWGSLGSWTLNDWAVFLVTGLLFASVVLFVYDLIASYWLNGANRERANGAFSFLFGKMETSKRIIAWLLLISVLTLLLRGTDAISFFLLSVAGFLGFIAWRKPLTEPSVAWGLLNLGLLFGGWSITDKDFRVIIVKPDNVPIVGLVFVVGFFTWLAFRKAVINDDRMAQGLPPAEKEEDEKVLVWPDLVYTELICMVVVTVILIVWAVALPAPVEQPAASTKTPNPSKAPWYFLGLQEMLVYYDPWIAGVLLPTIIIIGLMAIPYIDSNQKGNGYFTFNQRPFAIMNFLFGFVVLWVTLIFLGTFLRGPNWNFFGLYEPQDPHKVVPLNNVNLSDYIWVRAMGTVWEHPPGGVSVGVILIRELPGILIVLGYFLVLPPLLAKTVFRRFFVQMGFIRYFTMVTLLLFMASLPIKMVLRWTMNLKYIVAIPEFFFNI